MIAPGAWLLGAAMRAWANQGAWDSPDRWRGIRAFATLFAILWLAGLFFLIAHLAFLPGLLALWGLNTLWGPVFALMSSSASPANAQPASLTTSPAVGSLPAAFPTSSGTSASEEAIDGALILGKALSGDLWEWVKGGYLTFPAWALNLHAVVLGRSGAGKSETLLRIAYLAAKIYKWRVYFVDAKGDWTLAVRFRLLMQQAGIPDTRIGMFPNTAHNGFLGTDRDLLNKLLQSQQWSEPFYREVATNLLWLALHAPGTNGPPPHSRELLRRLRPAFLLEAYKGRPEAAELKLLDNDKFMGAYYRFAAFFRAANGKLDGSTSFGNWDAAYYLLDGVRLKDETARLGQYLLEDFEQYLAVKRQNSAQERTLIIVDDYSAISAAASATSMFERIRGLGGAVVIAAQSEESLGNSELEIRRLMGTASTVLLHSAVLPKATIEAAGMLLTPQFSWHLPTMTDAPSPPSDEEEEEEQTRLTLRYENRVRQNDVQKLQTGQLYCIHGGLAQLATVSMLSYDHDIEQQGKALEKAYLAQSQSSKRPGAPPTPASPPLAPQKLDDLIP